MKHHKRMEAAQDGEPAVKARWASFAWEREMPPALHEISLEAIKGQLVMVVGVVGSGKSSLIAALLGELHGRGGTVEVLYICKVLNQQPVSDNSISQGPVLMCSDMFPFWLLVHVCIFHTYIMRFPLLVLAFMFHVVSQVTSGLACWKVLDPLQPLVLNHTAEPCSALLLHALH